MGSPERRAVDDLIAMRAGNWPETVTPVTSLMVRVFRLSDLAQQNAAELISAHGLTFKEFEVLATLRSFAAGRGVTPGDLCAAILISSGGLTKVLYGLEEKGFVARAEGGADKRSKPVRLTARGRKLAERAMGDIIRSDTQIMEDALTAREVETLTGLVGKVLARLEPADGPQRRKERGS